MAEEVRFFARTVLFTIVIATIYWFVSYEEAGSVLLAGIAASAALFALVILVTVPSARRGGRGLRSFLGFEEKGPDDPLALEEDVFPLASAWPAIVSLSAALIGLGLIYGAWLWIPGTAIGLAGAWGWIAETED